MPARIRVGISTSTVTAAQPWSHENAAALGGYDRSAVPQAVVDWTVSNGGLAAALDDILAVLVPPQPFDELTLKILRGNGASNTIIRRPTRGLANAPAEFTETRRALMLARALGYSGARLDVEQFGIFSMLFTDPKLISLRLSAHTSAHCCAMMLATAPSWYPPRRPYWRTT